MDPDLPLLTEMLKGKWEGARGQAYGNALLSLLCVEAGSWGTFGFSVLLIYL